MFANWPRITWKPWPTLYTWRSFWAGSAWWRRLDNSNWACLIRCCARHTWFASWTRHARFSWCTSRATGSRWTWYATPGAFCLYRYSCRIRQMTISIVNIVLKHEMNYRNISKYFFVRFLDSKWEENYFQVWYETVVPVNQYQPMKRITGRKKKFRMPL